MIDLPVERDATLVLSIIYSPVSRSFFYTSHSILPIEFDKIESNNDFSWSDSGSFKIHTPIAHYISETEGFCNILKFPDKISFLTHFKTYSNHFKTTKSVS